MGLAQKAVGVCGAPFATDLLGSEQPPTFDRRGSTSGENPEEGATLLTHFWRLGGDGISGVWISLLVIRETMAPVLHRKSDIDSAVSLVYKSVVSVELFKIGPTYYKSLTGFVISASQGATFIAANFSQVEKDPPDVIHVIFSDGIIEEATVISKSTFSGHVILKVQVSGDQYPPVNLDDKKVLTDIVILLSNIRENGRNTYSTSVICPDNDSDCKKENVVGKADFFTLGFSIDINTIIGAPIFDLDGHLVGTVHSCDGKFGPTYAQHALSFVPALREMMKGFDQVSEK
ncbi:uncharacterized protein LOC124672589 [Lolium rigidum]|uniref:uncharacterized protein LOC124672589 n=1 Tax=Lolium rigidum TaxID=89674 RepID=UPI001F5E332D|nr:uncharacterized protein LOC124672589 [Lolium rigidum]